MSSTATRPLHKPEILAPAGSWDCARAAVENGADAIYFGLDRFNARMRADNFTETDLPDLMAFLHKRGVRGYLTFNTLVFPDELADAADYLRAAINAGVDAAIVQDVGICRLIRRLSPDFPIHGSTQMTITSDAGVDFARDLGCSLVVLARECSVAEIEKLQDKLTETGATLPLEIFVHGALCVAYSGQCLTSESLGGRSANRGECAQACRLPYDLICDGKQVALGDRRYLLSPQDLAGLEVLPDLVRAGLTSLKIEGRLKAPEYVANVTRVYRQALNRVFAELTAGHDAAALPAELKREHGYNLQMGFSRGLYTGWLKGVQNQELAHARYPHKRGVLLGQVVELHPRERLVGLRLEAPVRLGDGVVFDLGRPEDKETGGRLWSVTERNHLTYIGFGAESIDWNKVAVGALVWKTNDPVLDKELRATFSAEKPNHRRPVSLTVYGAVGMPLTLEVRDEAGRVLREDSQVVLETAQKQPLTTEKLRDQLGRLGDTSFVLAGLDNRLEGAVIVPVSELNRLRRSLFARLEELRTRPPRWTLPGTDASLAKQITPGSPPSAGGAASASELVLMVRDLAQLEAVLPLAHHYVYAEFEDPKKYREAMALVRAHRETTGRHVELFVAPPRVFKMGEDWILKIVRSSEPDGYLARNAEHLRAFAGSRLRGDFSLNVANALTAEHYRANCGLESVTASYDLNVGQLESLLKSAPPEWFEVTVHQHMPMFHMEHCVFCAFLSKGKDYKDCGRPCEKHEVRLRDRVGAEHVLKADAGCRNTLYNSRAQTGSEIAGRLGQLGLRRFRVDFLTEDAATIQATVRSYEKLLKGELSGDQLWRDLKLLNQLGVTRGTHQTSGKRVG